MTDILDRIVEQNLGVYRAAQSRLQEDVSQEAQVTSDYRGRLVYELLQNADDAMGESPDDSDRVSFLVSDDYLWIANSGRPLTDEDVQGLCGLGASSKVDAHGTRRASIGHKGLGFKSVLEITERPAVYSRTYSFELGTAHARPHVDPLWGDLGLKAPRSVPAMRFPARLDGKPDAWLGYEADSLNTAFCFPFADGVNPEQRSALAELLLQLPLTTVLFLKHLEIVDVLIDRAELKASRSWRIERERFEAGSWNRCRSLDSSGLYRVKVQAQDGESATFLVGHDGDVEIGPHRTGLSGPAWDGVELTEVSVAALAPGSDRMPDEWRRFHVFLPTEEGCPYPLLVNGAFTTDLSRQQVRVSDDPHDYNSYLIRTAASVVREQLLPVLLEEGAEALLTVLDRELGESVTAGEAADRLHSELIDALRDVPLLPTEEGGVLALREMVLPPAILGVDGPRFRDVLRPDPIWDERRFPARRFCAGRWARVAADHGALELEPGRSVDALATLHDPVRASLLDDESGGFELDPLLELVTAMWERANPGDRTEIESRARSIPLFPVRRNDDRTVERVTLGEQTAFYPPRSARHELPLTGLQFMCHSVCWGALQPRERTVYLEQRMKVWAALFEIKEFRFEEVVRAAVIPALVLNPDVEATALLESLKNLNPLAAVCQLAGSFAKPDRPLRYQRLQSDRALFNLSRLPVPCRALEGEEERWMPAYRVYFGADWIGDASVEAIARALPGVQDPLNFSYLAPPDRFLGTLPDLDGGTAEAGASPQDGDEVSLDEDTDQALETSERDRWLSFLSWVGVNRALRPVHFHDVEDDATGWLTTKDLKQPEGWAFRDLDETWEGYRAQLKSALDARPGADDTVPYLYEVHDLEAIVPLLGAAEKDASCQVGRALFSHLAQHWSWYSAFADAQLALIDMDKSPSARNRPQRAMDQELATVGDNLWLFRLRSRGFCPTSLGPRRPDVTWQRSAEVERRFGRRGQSPGKLLPLLAIEPGLPAHGVRVLSERLGIRSDLSPSTFSLKDARTICQQLRRIFDGPSAEVIDATRLRTVIKPAYRQMFELLSGHSPETSQPPPLAGEPMLSESDQGMSFMAAREVLYARTPGIRERSGVSGRVPSFVLEAEPAATAPLQRLFGMRMLEDVLEWQPDPGECPLDVVELDAFKKGLAALVPPLLARIRVERTESRDKTLLMGFASRVEPIDELHLTCMLDGVYLDSFADRPYFVRQSTDAEQLQAFVVWSGPPWPPDADSAQALAMALADTLEVNLVETFLAFIQSDDSQRRRLLDIAGASGLIQEIQDELSDEESEPEGFTDNELAPTPAPDSEDGEHEEKAAHLSPADSVPAAPPVPLLKFEDITMDGEPVLVYGDSATESGGASGGAASSASGAAGSHASAAPGTDLAALDRLGMSITMGYEVRRLRHEGMASARILLVEPGKAEEDSLVVDVHSPQAIQHAEEASVVVSRVMKDLESRGISRLYPGFDVLTIAAGQVDRLIELKSSGVDARVQAMSWNEWKSARASKIRPKFWLYLVGNLRADLTGTKPFVRGIKDPFGSLAYEETENLEVTRAVQLRVREFREAEHLDLGVVSSNR
jgi:hypothetical protein